MNVHNNIRSLACNAVNAYQNLGWTVDAVPLHPLNPAGMVFLFFSVKTWQMRTYVQHDNNMMAAMHNMTEEMGNASVHGDPDNHFARMMQLHHAGALKMGELVLQEGRDPILAGMARDMIQKQKEEIAALQFFLNNHRPMPHSQNAAFNTEMKKVMDNMEINAAQEELNGDPDHDFAALMIHHHQAAIDMADLIIQYGSNADIKRMAGVIRTDQEAEIQALLRWLNERREGFHL
jgi:uncharacterized protein (DUF305 family)